MHEALSTVTRRLNTGGGILSGQDPLEDTFSLFLVQAVIIIGITRALSVVGYYLKQPRVIFEIIGGILLGPSAIGRDEEFLLKIFPHSSLSYIGLVANIGLTLYLFLVGMELDVPKLATHAKKAGGVAILGMAVPFALGIAISKTMFDNLQADDPKFKDVKITSFFVFIGTAMSITAFPVLARILKEGGLIYSRAGALVMGAAALNDAIAWCLLILAISIANAKDMAVAGWVFLSVAAFAVGLYVIIRPMFERLVAYVESLNSRAMNGNLFALTLICVFLSAWTTALLGLDAIFGAFLFGLIIPRDTVLFKECNEFIEELVLTFTLPLYFALSGLKTDVTQISTGEQGAMIVLVCFVATVGKFVGCGGTAWLSGLSFRESSTVAVLMNTRGLVELIVLNLGMESGILSVKTFSVMVIMCLFTTFITCPLVEYIYPPHLRGDDGAKKSGPENRELVTNADLDEDLEEIDLEHHRDIANISRECHLGIVVDRMEHLQGLINLVSSYQPLEDRSQLYCTVVKFEEPSMTEEDTFIGLNEFDRLISVEEEQTSIDLATFDPSKTLRPPKLLPLTMHCKSLGASVSAFDVRGDPLEFSKELKSMAVSFDCDLIVMPWRASPFLEQLFWGSVRKVTCPIALFVQVDIPVQLLPEGVSQRARANSISLKFSSDGPPRPARKFSQYNIALTISPRKPFQTIVVVMTGRTSDLSMLPATLRFMEKPSTQITVFTTSDRMTFDPEIRAAWRSFKEIIADKPNVRIVKLLTPSTDLDSIYKEIIRSSYDLCLCSFIAPNTTTTTSPSTGNADVESQQALTPPHQPPANTRSSVTAAFAQSLLSAEPSVTERRIKMGVPEEMATSSLEHLELGVLGNRLHDSQVITNILVFHEPVLHVVARSRATMTTALTYNDDFSTRTIEMVDQKLNFTKDSNNNIDNNNIENSNNSNNEQAIVK